MSSTVEVLDGGLVTFGKLVLQQAPDDGALAHSPGPEHHQPITLLRIRHGPLHNADSFTQSATAQFSSRGQFLGRVACTAGTYDTIRDAILTCALKPT